jgi:predicted metalloprotease
VIGAIILAVQYCPGMMSSGPAESPSSTSTPAPSGQPSSQGAASTPSSPSSKGEPTSGDAVTEEELVRYTGYVFDDVQSAMVDDVERKGRRYQPARIVVYREAVSSGCGNASSSVGPFYCPNDGKVYVDLSFYRELNRRFGAPGDFAEAYVIAHEVGHHIQNLFGALESRSNKESVQVELQADCLAGVWAADAERRGLLEAGDLREAMTAAASVGDDRIQEQTTGRINRESFTHGSSEQRQAAFQRGHDGRSLDACGL